VSFDIGASLIGNGGLLYNRDEPVRLAIVPAEVLDPIPDEITLDQALLAFMVRFPSSADDICREECAVLESTTVPGCLQIGSVRDQLRSTLMELLPTRSAYSEAIGRML
jgi:hypothetical protein